MDILKRKIQGDADNLTTFAKRTKPLPPACRWVW